MVCDRHYLCADDGQIWLRLATLGMLISAAEQTQGRLRSKSISLGDGFSKHSLAKHHALNKSVGKRMNHGAVGRRC